MAQNAQHPFGLTHPSIAGQLDLMESIAEQLPELFDQARKQAYDEAVMAAVKQGLPPLRGNLLLERNPYAVRELAA